MQSLDLLANNLANSGTAGFKNDAEYYGLYNSGDGDGGQDLPMVQRQWTDYSQGPLQVTGNATDVALQGQGFFVVQGPTGPLYTRNGNLQRLSTGELANSEGYKLLDTTGNPIQIDASKPFEVSTDGTVTQNGQPVAQINVVQFANPQNLNKAGGTCFQNPDPKKNIPTAAQGVEVLQGKIESSNVPVAQSAMRLVGVMRQFEMLQKAVGISSEMDTKSIQEVARVTT